MSAAPLHVIDLSAAIFYCELILVFVVLFAAPLLVRRGQR